MLSTEQTRLRLSKSTDAKKKSQFGQLLTSANIAAFMASLFPSRFYCVVRRFSSKEEKRRIVASVVDPGSFDNVPMLGFENHLNLFHENKRGLPQALARGLAVFINTTAVDDDFRRFSGHTQVNAADLKMMKYPSRETLSELGEWAVRQVETT